MTEHRFFVSPDRLSGTPVQLPPDVAQQIRMVLRLRPGEHISLLDGSGMQHEAELLSVSAAGVTARILGTQAAIREPQLKLTLCPALLKADRFEWVVQKCTELGVAAIQPVLSARCVAAAASAQKLARWRRIAQEAAEQSGRGVVPTVAEPLALDTLPVETMLPVLVAYELERHVSLHSCIAGMQQMYALTLLIGPEGGFAAEEVQRLTERGARAFSLGARTLRAETACVAAVAAAMLVAGEMG